MGVSNVQRFKSGCAILPNVSTQNHTRFGGREIAQFFGRYTGRYTAGEPGRQLAISALAQSTLRVGLCLSACQQAGQGHS